MPHLDDLRLQSLILLLRVHELKLLLRCLVRQLVGLRLERLDLTVQPQLLLVQLLILLVDGQGLCLHLGGFLQVGSRQVQG